MTEFDIGWLDELERADWFEDSIRAFFGHPKMTGVVSWRMWDETVRDHHHEMVQGPNTSHIKVRSSGSGSSNNSSSGRTSSIGGDGSGNSSDSGRGSGCGGNSDGGW